MNQKINPRPLVLTAMIIAVGIFRIVTANTHSSLSGFTPLGAMALFGGFYFRDQRKAYLFPLLTLWFSDIILNRFVYFGEWVFYYNSMAFVYGSFAFIVWIGERMQKASIKNLAFVSVLTAVTHMLISNFGVWLMGCTGSKQDTTFSPDIQGLLQCYTLGLPSMGNFLIGNIFFCAILFGAFEVMQRRFEVLRYQPS